LLESLFTELSEANTGGVQFAPAKLRGAGTPPSTKSHAAP
jgi:hypothetical protein